MLLDIIPLVIINIISLFWMFSVLIIMCQGKFVFWYGLFGVLYVYSMLVSITLFRLGKFFFLWFCFEMFLHFFFLYSYYSWIWCFHSVSYFWHVLCQDSFRFNILFNWGIYVFSCVFNARDYLFYLLYSVGETCL